MQDMQVYEQSTLTAPSICNKAKHSKRREEPATIRFSTRPTKRQRTEVDHSVQPQQNLRPITDLTQFDIQNIDPSPNPKDKFHMPTAAIADTDMDSMGDSWKELTEKALAGKHPTGPGNAALMMITRMNELWPFSKAKGIFDNGCGTGAILSHILEQYGVEIPPSARILAGDFSDHMLQVVRKTKQAKSESPEKDVWGRVEIRNIDAQDLSSIPDDSVSHLTGGMVYFMLPDAQKALKESNRVLCPGGVIALSSGKSSEHIDALGEAVEKIRPGTHLTLLTGVWASEVGVKKELEAAGFVDVETHLVASSMGYQSHQQFAEMLLQMPVMKNVVDGFSEEEESRLLQGTVDRLRAINPVEPVAAAGMRVADLYRTLIVFNTAESKVGKLITKHMKLAEMTKYLQETKVGIIITTPKRLRDLIEAKAVDLSSLRRIVIDGSYQNEKTQTLLDMKDTFAQTLELMNVTALKGQLGPLKSHPSDAIAHSPHSPGPCPSDISSASSLTAQQVDDALQTALSFQKEAASVHSKLPSVAILLSPDKSTILFSHFFISHMRHAESELARLAVDHFSTSYLSNCILVSTWEPCAMCAGTIYWSGIGTIVYAASETKLRELVGSDDEQMVGLSLPCRTVLESGRRQVEVIGPVPGWEDRVVKESAKWWREHETRPMSSTSATQNVYSSARKDVKKQTPAERGNVVTTWTGEDSVLSSIGEDGEYKAELNIDWMR
ncbi:hypothetical protein DV737_g875, partial [Chaetothyriales sp. CBS 132003]